VIELHLIGYTEDGDHLVFDLDDGGEGSYVAALDPDLLATLEAARRERIARGKPVDVREDVAPVGADPAPSPAGGDTGDGQTASAPPPLPAVPTGAGAEETPAEVSPSGLSPAEIQARLRAGRSVRAVAREAGADAAWVEGWHTPIVAERERVLADARSRRLDRPRARPLGTAVDRSLLERGVPPDAAVWRVARRRDGRWRVSVRFEEDGRTRTATWLLDPDAEHLRAQSSLATELSAPGGGGAAGR
jgi:hypothetical protein